MNSKAGVGSTTAASAFNHLYQDALDKLDVDRRARDAGVINQPPTNSTTLDANEREFVAHFSNQLRVRKTQSEEKLSKYALDRTATSARIDIDETRASLARLFNAIEPDLARLRQDHQQDLERAKDDEARALRQLRYFQVENKLHTREAVVAPPLVWHFAIVAAFAVLEWVSLSIFYAEGSDFGLLGGVLMAMALSMINIVLAVFIGAILRYLNHRSLGRKLLAVLGTAILISLFLFATGFAAHYRNAAREIASSQASTTQTQSETSTQSPASKKAEVSPMDDEQWRSSKRAWENFSERGFVFHDVMSWLLVILAIIFGFTAAWKGYGIDDPYPGYGPIYRQYRERSKAYEEAKRRYTQVVDNIFTSVGEKQQGLIREIRKHIEYFQESARKSEVETSSFSEFAREVEQACNDVLVRYRQLNREVAGSVPPAYFRERAPLDDSLKSAPEPLSDADRSRLREYTDAIREFTSAVRDDDEKSQKMRTQSIAGLTQFFASIERTIDDKLARESIALED